VKNCNSFLETNYSQKLTEDQKGQVTEKKLPIRVDPELRRKLEADEQVQRLIEQLRQEKQVSFS